MNTTMQQPFSGLRPGAKILFANFGADGHFNPLTGIAVHLKQKGFDVRWYTSTHYQRKIENLGIPFFPFVKAMDVRGDNVSEVFPEREKCKSQVARLNFDISNVFIRRGPEFYEDIREIYKHFCFDVLVADVLFTGIPYVADLMNIPVVGVGVIPITKNSKDLPPAGIGLTPSYSFLGKQRQNLMRFMASRFLFASANKVMRQVLAAHNIICEVDSVFDLLATKCSVVLQTGTPGFEYKRSDLPANYKFAGPLLPYQVNEKTEPWHHPKLSQYSRIILVTQGTVEKNENKLLVPALEAFSNTDMLLIVTTGGSNTAVLREKYQAPNLIIEDFIPFADVMPYADVYITNGGMGGVLQSIQNELPMVVAGVHEGKNEICARVGYFNLGVNLKTETPTIAQLKKSVNEVLNKSVYRQQVRELGKEFGRYNSAELCEKYIAGLIPFKTQVQREVREMEIG